MVSFLSPSLPPSLHTQATQYKLPEISLPAASPQLLLLCLIRTQVDAHLGHGKSDWEKEDIYLNKEKIAE